MLGVGYEQSLKTECAQSELTSDPIADLPKLLFTIFFTCQRVLEI